MKSHQNQKKLCWQRLDDFSDISWANILDGKHRFQLRWTNGKTFEVEASVLVDQRYDSGDWPFLDRFSQCPEHKYEVGE